MKSYRESHVSAEHGRRYDAVHENKVDALIWDAFIKGLVSEQAKTCAATGASRYLDFACGTGRVLKIGAVYFKESLGIDISNSMLEVARERVPTAQFIQADVTREPNVVSGDFQFVTIFRFLLNAETSLSMAVLAWLAQHMPPGAILIGNNHMSTFSFRGIATVISNTILGTKLNHLSRRQVTRMLEESGFRVKEWSGYRVLPSFKGKPVLGQKAQIALERFLHSAGLGRIGSEHVFVAERI